MDIDITLIRKVADQPAQLDGIDLNVTVRDGYLFIRQEHLDIADDIELKIINFLSDIIKKFPECIDEKTTLEVASYYDINKKYNAEFSLTPKLMHLLSDKNIYFNFVGYPCED